MISLASCFINAIHLLKPEECRSCRNLLADVSTLYKDIIHMSYHCIFKRHCCIHSDRNRGRWYLRLGFKIDTLYISPTGQAFGVCYIYKYFGEKLQYYKRISLYYEYDWLPVSSMPSIYWSLRKAEAVELTELMSAHSTICHVYSHEKCGFSGLIDGILGLISI